MEETSGKLSKLPSLCVALLPAAAAATSLASGLWAALAVFLFGSVARLASPALRKRLGERVGRFSLTFVISTLCAVGVSLLEVIDPHSALALGLYLPLAAVSGILATGIPSEQEAEAPPSADFSLLAISAVIIAVAGALREAFGASTLTLPLDGGKIVLPFPGKRAIGLLQNPAGILFLLGYLAAVCQWAEGRRGKGASS